MRSDEYLKSKAEKVWEKYFNDFQLKDRILVKFGRKASKRLGSIRRVYPSSGKSFTMVIINGYFRHKNVPDYVIESTLAHELCHYIHGFGSSLPKKCRYPHRGGIVDKEMHKRGISSLLKKETKWLNENWHTHITDQAPVG